MILRWDSWRFYEALAAGCIAINIHEEEYGLEYGSCVREVEGVHKVYLTSDRAGTSDAILTRVNSDSRIFRDFSSSRSLEKFDPMTLGQDILNLAG